jgi:hypothetical protein
MNTLLPEVQQISARGQMPRTEMDCMARRQLRTHEEIARIGDHPAFGLDPSVPPFSPVARI